MPHLLNDHDSFALLPARVNEHERQTLGERVRKLHTQMLDCLLAGEGLEQAAALSAEAVGGRVAIVLPGLEVVAAPEVDPATSAVLARYVRDRLRGRPVEIPTALLVDLPVVRDDVAVGAVLMLEHSGRVPEPDASELIHVTVGAVLTSLAMTELRSGLEETLCGSLLEHVRGGEELEPATLVRRAARLGCDLSGKSMVLCVRMAMERPHRVIALIGDEWPGSIAEHLEGRVYAILPGGGETDPAARVHRLIGSLRAHGVVGVSSVYETPGDLRTAMKEAELILDVLSVGQTSVDADALNSGTYRMLFRLMLAHPEEVEALYESTVAPLVRYDDQYGTDLLETLFVYLETTGNVKATATRVYAHRHTVAYRLDRIRELTNLNPAEGEDRERLGLGLKAHSVLGARTPRR